MPSQRRRIGFLPSEEVHHIIDKLSKANEFSQSKVTGLLVEEALRSRGVLSQTFQPFNTDKGNFINYSFEQKHLTTENNSKGNGENYTINKIDFENDIKLMHEFIEFKYFKRVMRQNNNIFE